MTFFVCAVGGVFLWALGGRFYRRAIWPVENEPCRGMTDQYYAGQRVRCGEVLFMDFFATRCAPCEARFCAEGRAILWPLDLVRVLLYWIAIGAWTPVKMLYFGGTKEAVGE